MMLNPKTEALAFRIWAICDPVGWDISVSDCAKQSGERLASVRRVVHLKGWTHRFRSCIRYNPRAPMISGAMYKISEEDLGGLLK